MGGLRCIRNNNNVIILWYIDFSISGQQVDDWFPNDPNNLQNVWSLHFENTALTSVDEVEKDDLVLAPNPALDQLTITFDNTEHSSAELEVFDVSGKKMASQRLGKIKNGENKVIVDLSSMAKGIYFCNITFGDKVISEKFIKK